MGMRRGVMVQFWGMMRGCREAGTSSLNKDKGGGIHRTSGVSKTDPGYGNSSYNNSAVESCLTVTSE